MKNLLKLILLVCLPGIGIGQMKVQPAFEFLDEYPRVRDLSICSVSGEAWFTIQTPLEERSAVAFFDLNNSREQNVSLAPFSGTWNDTEPFILSSGLRLYFVSDRPLQAGGTAKDFDIWYVERSSLRDPWSEPKNLGAPVNSPGNEFYPSLSSNGNLYFTLIAPGETTDDIFFAEKSGNGYLQPTALGAGINTTGYEYNSFVASDESYLIFGAYNRENGYGSGDLYISFKNIDGSWSQSVNMGPAINSDQMDYCAFFEPNSDVFYFTSRRSEIRQDSFHSVQEFLSEARKYANGYSRLYKLDNFSSYLDSLKRK